MQLKGVGGWVGQLGVDISSCPVGHTIVKVSFTAFHGKRIALAQRTPTLLVRSEGTPLK
jgi:hypothetical protein